MPSQHANLHRSKSATSVKERRKHPIPAEPQDPDAARLHALVAAHRAMDQSQIPSSDQVQRANSNASQRSNATVQHHLRFSPASQLRRQRSMLQSKAPHLAAALQVPQESRGARHVATESAMSEFGSMTENYRAEPSSYRRVRRTKSMLTPRRRLFSPTSSPRTPLSQAATLRHTASVANISVDGPSDAGLGLRIRKSFNFLRPTSRISVHHRAETSLGSRDEAVSLAQSQYNDSIPQAGSRKPSLIFQKIRRQNKAFRKTVRSQAFTEPVGSTASDTALTDQISTKRTFSSSFRHRFMKVFTKSVNNRQEIPPQQLDATRRHFSSESNDNGQSTSFDDYEVGVDNDRRQSFYVRSRSAADDEEELDHVSSTSAAVGGRESLRSSSRSRVTSWTNSSSTSSSATRTGALQQNRLSIIKEDGGPAQPSSSAGRHFGGISVFQEPLTGEDENGHPLPPVDSQRIYSALMKRIGEEEVEMEQTRAALAEIHNRHDHDSQYEEDITHFSSIRAVSSTTKASSDCHGRGTDEEEQSLGAGLDASRTQDDGNIGGRKEQSPLQEDQQSFFPFSGQGTRAARSPFRKFLDERKSQDLDQFNNSTEENRVLDDSMRRSHAALSSESIYSTTTNGGVNEDYIPPVMSMDNLTTYQSEAHEVTGMATVVPNSIPLPVETVAAPAMGNGEHEWRGWLQGQVDTLTRSDSKTANHFREYAQIDSDDVDVGGSSLKLVSSKSSGKQRFPLLDLKEVPSHNTPIPKRSSSLTKSHSGLLKRASVHHLDTVPEKQENHKATGGLRKISPGNIARMLKERKSQPLRNTTDGHGKENRPSIGPDDSPPLSTPGRLGLQLRSGNGRLRKRASEMAFGSNKHDDSADKKTATPGRYRGLTYDESPTDRVKQSLSARLSRPFNMDVPEPNRPFDSMYLGKGELGSTASGRLSVAQSNHRGPKGYGGLGGNPFDGEQDTALPEMLLDGQPSGNANSDGKAASGGLWSSKRMVSDFLRKRRLRESSEEKSKEGSPAFI